MRGNPARSYAAFDVNQLNSLVQGAAIDSRAAEIRAGNAAAAARQAAHDAEQAGGNYGERGLVSVFWRDGNFAGDHYAGETSAGQKVGVGTYIFSRVVGEASPSRYEGEWASDRQEGYGVNTYSDGTVFAGRFRNGVPVLGVVRYSNGTVFEGERMGEQANGYGVLWSSDGRPVQTGLWSSSVLTLSLPRGSSD